MVSFNQNILRLISFKVGGGNPARLLYRLHVVMSALHLGFLKRNILGLIDRGRVCVHVNSLVGPRNLTWSSFWYCSRASTVAAGGRAQCADMCAYFTANAQDTGRLNGILTHHLRNIRATLDALQYDMTTSLQVLFAPCPRHTDPLFHLLHFTALALSTLINFYYYF